LVSKRYIFIFCLVGFFACLCVSLKASSNNSSIELRNAAEFYKNKQYTQALDIYEKLLVKKPRSYGLYYNIGNIYFQLNNIGKSVYFYKRAQQYFPRDKEILGNLKIAISKRIDSINSDSDNFSFLNVINYFSMNEFYIVFLIFLTGISIVTFIMVRNRRGEFFLNLFFVMLVCFILFFACFLLKAREEYFVSRGVIIAKKIEVKAGPANTLPTLFFIHEGIDFIVKKSLNHWVEIKLKNGFIGWVNEKDVLIL
jgi:tetratricopeptide (TPR) repeat protein